MSTFMCIRNCITLYADNTPKRWKAGDKVNGDKALNHHFVEVDISKDPKEDDIEYILTRELKKYGIKVKDGWSVDRMQQLLAEKKKIKKDVQDIKADEEEAAELRGKLKEAGIAFHPALGLKKLRAMWEKYQIEAGKDSSLN